MNSDYLLLQEEHNVEYEPTEEEIREEARFLGIDDEDYLWLQKKHYEYIYHKSFTYRLLFLVIGDRIRTGSLVRLYTTMIKPVK